MAPGTTPAGTPFAALAMGVDLLDEAVLSTVRDVHGAIGRRVRGVADVVSGHRTAYADRGSGLSGSVYAGIGCGLRGVSRGLRAVDRAGLVPPLEETARGRFVLSAVSGIFGDRIVERHPELAFDLAVRRHARDVALTSEGLAAAYPEATGSLVVLAHGLSESDTAWARARVDVEGVAEDSLTYADTLVDLGWSPVVLRWNTGLTLSENGAGLARLLDEVVAAWPVPVERIALVGHSMGGLLARRACAEPGHAWIDLVSDVVTLGTPHLGAPIARGLTDGVSLLRLLPETAPFGALLDHRSAGVLDLRSGLADDVRRLSGARYHLVAATVHPSPRHPVGWAAGDLLVRRDSALARRRGQELFPGADTLDLPGADHFALLNHARVHAALREWLAP